MITYNIAQLIDSKEKFIGAAQLLGVSVEIDGLFTRFTHNVMIETDYGDKEVTYVSWLILTEPYSKSLPEIFMTEDYVENYLTRHYGQCLWNIKPGSFLREDFE